MSTADPNICVYEARVDDPSNWGGESPSDWRLEKDIWGCPHEVFDCNEVDDPQYCVFHMRPENVPQDVDEAEEFVRVINEESNSDDPETAKRKKQFVGARFGAFEIKDGTTLNAPDDFSIWLHHATFQEGVSVNDVVFHHAVRAPMATFNSSEGFSKRAHDSIGERGVSFVGTRFTIDVVFSEATFTGGGDVVFSEATFTGDGGVWFDGAAFSGGGEVWFDEVEFTSVRGAWFNRAKFTNSEYVSFSGAEFTGSRHDSFFAAEFNGRYGNVAFNHATLENVDLRGIDLTGANLQNANLNGSDLRDTKLEPATCDGIEMSGVKMNNNTRLDVLTRRNSRVSRDHDKAARGAHALREAAAANGLRVKARKLRYRERKERRREAGVKCFSYPIRLSDFHDFRLWSGSWISLFITGYGVSVSRIAATIVLVILGSAAGFYVMAGVPEAQTLSGAFWFSIETFVLGEFGGTPPVEMSSSAEALYTGEAFVGTLFTILLGYILAVRDAP